MPLAPVEPQLGVELGGLAFLLVGLLGDQLAVALAAAQVGPQPPVAQPEAAALARPGRSRCTCTDSRHGGGTSISAISHHRLVSAGAPDRCSDRLQLARVGGGVEPVAPDPQPDAARRARAAARGGARARRRASVGVQHLRQPGERVGVERAAGVDGARERGERARRRRAA